jgi:hypothetical protein
MRNLKPTFLRTPALHRYADGRIPAWTKEAAFLVWGTLVMLATDLFLAWVLHLLWGWFVVPQFGVRPLGTVVAFGMYEMTMVLPWDVSKDLQDSTITKVVTGLLVLALGYSLSFFV